ncbi:MAG: hypothetical protein HQM08_18630 [Candidatus Riflebacteria bacterium]|nr:hypothetical protein [Candidatus Riflebacteria bacterium]
MKSPNYITKYCENFLKRNLVVFGNFPNLAGTSFIFFFVFFASILFPSTKDENKLENLISEPGFLEISVESILEKTPKKFSKMAVKAEIWSGDIPLACLKKGDDGVIESPKSRKFCFPKISLPVGYYFITIKFFAEGMISRDLKWKSKIIQVGISSGKTTRVSEILPFFVW